MGKENGMKMPIDRMMVREQEFCFLQARAIWGEDLKESYNQFVGFHTYVDRKREGKASFRIAARSYYRLYLDGKMIAHGPARTAEGYCRVDEFSVEMKGGCHIAVEVAAYDKPKKYCNDCTMELGMLTMEILDEEGDVLTATGQPGWTCRELTERRSCVETMSHSRGIVEYYDLTPESFDWRVQELMETPVLVAEEPFYLIRRAPYPTYHAIPFPTLTSLMDMRQTGSLKVHRTTLIAKAVNARWYAQIPEENVFVEELMAEEDAPFTGKYQRELLSDSGRQRVHMVPGHGDMGVMWERNESEVGFLDFSVTVSCSCVLDVLNSDVLNEAGMLEGNTYVTRYHLQPGSYHLTTFEPKLVRYVKMIVRTAGEVVLISPVLLDYSYPDTEKYDFRCSDNDLNRIYDAARRTLRLNTLDIFMDCPERERGGWLCDSYFTARGAWQMFGDLSVERDFIENFMLTGAEDYQDHFFPEVYPGVHEPRNEPGIRNWSFWLLEELYEFFERSGDRKLIRQWEERVSILLDHLITLRGKSGLLEDIGSQFVDWSLSNESFAIGPISVPNNCLAVDMLRKMAELYDRLDWRQAAEEMHAVLMTLQQNAGDSVKWEENEQRVQLKSGTCRTESGIALEIFSGYHKEDRAFLHRFVEQMGPAPIHRSDPNIGKSNLFIGLMIRFAVLAEMGKVDTLVREWKALYLEELRIGPGTLFESIQEDSGCHGFNACVGAMMTQLILGLGEARQRSKTITISPHPCGLTWASGSAGCEDGDFFLRWYADYEEHELDMMLLLPDGWKAEYRLPFELTGWKVRVNGEELAP
ncbi:hypothetical protein B5F07_19305 [Lachnoclostridium sp. An169]|nr:hypothetical protein B5F07_19305 [Lachnoclostridium sp. An169]